jgi:hypothetical protein
LHGANGLSGSSHRGRVRFEADIDFDHGTGRCHGTMCSKKRASNVSVKSDAFRLLTGKDDPGNNHFATRQGHRHEILRRSENIRGAPVRIAPFRRHTGPM